MKPEELNDFLKKRGTPCVQKAVQHGVQFRCETGEVLTVYKTGKVVIGGKRTPLCEELENLTAGAQPVAKSEPAPNARGEIFIVYGHDTMREARVLHRSAWQGGLCLCTCHPRRRGFQSWGRRQEEV
jgi:predicted nucleotide-binding protein